MTSKARRIKATESMKTPLIWKGNHIIISPYRLPRHRC